MNSVEVFYKDQLAGTLTRHADESFEFQYSKAYLSSDGPAISVTLPARAAPYVADRLFPFFDGLIPEGWLLNIASEKLRLNPLQDRYELLTSLCHDAIGAVSIGGASVEQPAQVAPDADGEKRWTDPRCLVCYDLLEPGQQVYHPGCMRKVFGGSVTPFVAMNQDLLEAMANDQINRKLAVTGAQKKLSLDMAGEGKTQRLTLTNLWGRFIFKPAGAPPHLPENEHLCMRLAAAAGMQVAEAALIPTLDGTLGYVAQRFDRSARGARYHQEDCCQMLNKETYKKYSGSLEQVGRILRRHSTFPGDDAYRLLELAVFNFLVGNADAHLKNYSMSYESEKGGIRQLSPAYDLLSTDLYIDQDPEESAIAINGRKNNLRRRDFEALAESIDVSGKVFGNIIVNFQKVQPAWHDLIDKSFLDEERKPRLKTLIDARVKRLTA